MIKLFFKSLPKVYLPADKMIPTHTGNIKNFQKSRGSKLEFSLEFHIFDTKQTNFAEREFSTVNPHHILIFLYFRLLKVGDPSLKDGKVSKDFEPLYESEVYKQSRFPNWLTFELSADEIDFSKELTIEIANLNIWGCNDYMCECTFIPDEFRSQFTPKRIALVHKFMRADEPVKKPIRRRVIAAETVEPVAEQVSDKPELAEVVEDSKTDKAGETEQTEKAEQAEQTEPAEVVKTPEVYEIVEIEETSESAVVSEAGYALVKRRIAHNNGVLTKDSCPVQEYRSFDEIVEGFHVRREIRREEEKIKIQAELLAEFQRFDIDGNGAIDCDEFCQILPSVWGLDVSRTEVEAMIAKVDSNDDGHIDFEEFTLCVQELENLYADKVRDARRIKKLKKLAELEEIEAREALEAQKEKLRVEAEEFERALVEKQEAEKKLAEMEKEKQMLLEEQRLEENIAWELENPGMGDDAEKAL